MTAIKQAACPDCGEAPGLYVHGVPFCLCCVSQYPNANVLREGPNVSHRAAVRPAIWGAIVAVLSFCAVWAWRAM